MPDRPIVLLTSTDGGTSAIIYNYLARNFAIARVVREEAVPRAEFLKKRARRLGWGKVAGQVLFRAMVVPYLQLRSRGRVAEICREQQLDATPIPAAITSRVPSVNSAECVALLRALDPGAVVVSGTRIIANEVLQAAPAKFINLHAGITPMYRGVHGGYWALVENDRANCGVTVHLVDAGIDTGNILGQATCTPTTKDNFATYIYLQVAAGLPLLKQAVADALAGRLQPRPYPTGASKLWTHPTVGEYLRGRLAQGVK